VCITGVLLSLRRALSEKEMQKTAEAGLDGCDICRVAESRDSWWESRLLRKSYVNELNATEMFTSFLVLEMGSHCKA
jgi:hypothetical protein